MEYVFGATFSFVIIVSFLLALKFRKSRRIASLGFLGTGCLALAISAGTIFYVAMHPKSSVDSSGIQIPFPTVNSPSTVQSPLTPPNLLPDQQGTASTVDAPSQPADPAVVGSSATRKNTSAMAGTGSISNETGVPLAVPAARNDYNKQSTRYTNGKTTPAPIVQNKSSKQAHLNQQSSPVGKDAQTAKPASPQSSITQTQTVNQAQVTQAQQGVDEPSPQQSQEVQQTASTQQPDAPMQPVEQRQSSQTANSPVTDTPTNMTTEPQGNGQ